MRSRSTAEFSKQKTCPSAEQILLYHQRGLAAGTRFTVAAHLATCDFCHAEMYLLTKHAPAAASGGARVELPSHLRRLAEDLLAEPSRALARFAELAFEKERLTLTDA